MKEKLEQINKEAIEQINKVNSLQEINELRVKYLVFISKNLSSCFN